MFGEFWGSHHMAGDVAKTERPKGVSWMSLLGLDLHAWEQLMLWSLGVAGLVAVAVFVTTASVVILQRREATIARRELDEYKVEAAQKIAEANARSREAEVELIKFRRPRSQLVSPPEIRAKITEALKPFKGTKFDIGYGREDREQADFLWWLLPSINDARWVHIDWRGGEVFKRWNWPGDHLMGVMAVINVSIELHPENREKLLQAANALAAALKSVDVETTTDDFNNSSENSDAIHLLVGPKR